VKTRSYVIGEEIESEERGEDEEKWIAVKVRVGRKKVGEVEPCREAGEPGEHGEEVEHLCRLQVVLLVFGQPAVEQACRLGCPAWAVEELKVVIEGGQEAQVFDDVAAEDQGGGDGGTGTDGPGGSEEPGAIEDPLGVMGQHPVEKGVGAGAASVHPLVELEVVLSLAAEGVG
jgi:hypothetical protein